MAVLFSLFKTFHFSKESGFEQLCNNHLEIKQTRVLILKSKEGDYFVLSNDGDFTNFVSEHKLPHEVRMIGLQQVLVERVAFNPDPDIEYCGVQFAYEDNPNKSYFIAGPRYQLDATHKDSLSETLAENLHKVLDFTYHNNDYIMKEIMSHFKGN